MPVRKGMSGLMVQISFITLLCLATGLPVSARVSAEGDGAKGVEADRTELAAVFLDGVKAYENGDYEESVRLFSEIAASGIENGLLYYNLGNALLKSGDLGRAILWYERARLLIPGNADLEFNLAHARGLTTDSMESTDTGVSKILFFWKHVLARRTILVLAICMNALFWILLTLALFTRRPALRRMAAASGMLAALFIVTSFYNAWEDANRRSAVVLPAEVSVRSGLARDSTELFRLHAGALVIIDRVQEGHARISFSRDRMGWLPLDSIGEIGRLLSGSGPGKR